MPSCCAGGVYPPPEFLPKSSRSPGEALSPLGEAALHYASLGWEVLPLHPTTEQLAIPELRGIRDAANDPKLIATWWRRCPEASIGVATGGDSGIWVLEIHRKERGDQALALLEGAHGALPLTVEAVSSDGVRLLFFRFLPELQLSTWGPLGPGLALKGPGQVVKAPPSAPPLSWVPEQSPFEIVPAVPPEALVALVRDRWSQGR